MTRRRNKVTSRSSPIPARVRESIVKDAHEAAKAGRTYEQKRRLYKRTHARLYARYRYQHEAAWREAIKDASARWRAAQ